MDFKEVGLDETMKEVLDNVMRQLGCSSVLILTSDHQGIIHIFGDSAKSCGGGSDDQATEAVQVSVNLVKQSDLAKAASAPPSGLKGRALRLAADGRVCMIIPTSEGLKDTCQP